MQDRRSALGPVLIVLASVALALTGCSSGQNPAVEATSAAISATSTVVPSISLVPPVSVAASTLPPEPVPSSPGTCPYLSSTAAADLNGQRVVGVRLDTGYDPPACSFLISNDTVQLSVWVFHASSPALATAAVDRAAPVATADPATLPPGWAGGRSGGSQGAVYAVVKDAVAVVVTTNQDQSLKAQRVTEAVISTLKL